MGPAIFLNSHHDNDTHTEFLRVPSSPKHIIHAVLTAISEILLSFPIEISDESEVVESDLGKVAVNLHMYYGFRFV